MELIRHAVKQSRTKSLVRYKDRIKDKPITLALLRIRARGKYRQFQKTSKHAQTELSQTNTTSKEKTYQQNSQKIKSENTKSKE